MKYIGVSLLALLTCSGCAPAETTEPEPAIKVEIETPLYQTIGSVEVLTSDLISKTAKVQKLGGAYQWSEGPVWIQDGGYLLFTDVPGNTIYKFKEDEGITTFLTPSGLANPKPDWVSSQGANGLYPLDDENIILADHGNRKLYKLNIKT